MNKSNKKFLILSVFGIFFVVCGHCYGINDYIFFSKIFPFYSFHMALFTFISGYFFKDIKIKEFINKRTNKLILTYLMWNTIYGVIVNLLNKTGIINFGKPLTLYNLFIAPFSTDSNQFNFNTPAWFLITIYFIQCIYLLINKFNKIIKIETKYAVCIITIVIATVELSMVSKGCNYGFWHLITRVCFLMPFYALGQIYKDIEKYDKLNNYAYFIILIVIQAILLQKFKNLKYNLNTLYFKHDYIVYIISSITGISFWLRISRILEKYIGNNKIINYIGNNTYSVMMHHVFAFYILNTLIGIIYKFSGRFGDFDVNEYKTTIWYVYNGNNSALSLIYVIFGVALPIFMKYIVIDKFRIPSIITSKCKTFLKNKK